MVGIYILQHVHYTVVYKNVAFVHIFALLLTDFQNFFE